MYVVKVDACCQPKSMERRSWLGKVTAPRCRKDGKQIVSKRRKTTFRLRFRVQFIERVVSTRLQILERSFRTQELEPWSSTVQMTHLVSVRRHDKNDDAQARPRTHGI